MLVDITLYVTPTVLKSVRAVTD